MFEPDQMGEVIDGDTIRFVRIADHSPERVWRAITDERELAAWMRYPVQFEARLGGRARFFDEHNRIEGKVFIFEPPRTLAFSFADVRNPEHMALAERDWNVRWDLEPDGDGCRITFVHRGLGGAHLWGVGEGWHGFLDQFAAYLDGVIDGSAPPVAGDDRKTLRQYRAHVSRQLLAWGQGAANDAREAVGSGQRDAALAAIDRLELATRQLNRIARQEGARPDYSLEDANPVSP
jgi:uncharacterized protein YndB with AHSA1/START domain